ncbi:hematopoietic progenitor cell antigen CD34 isoform X1 [Bufo gargarizans]|uniref:hematopoietic progenitor cell antigen CD34 isoform X1 n=1 Tax=Bufo gargarizans TaxID=30331 RepID=UPI001CF11D9A|nr:hematopoietic progenitor cell antigen CD34 isoform X1 [Bufo gargarizans]
MLPCSLRTWTRGQILLAMSILAALDTTLASESSTTTAEIAVNVTASAQSLPGNSPLSVTVHSSSDNQTSTASPMLTGPTVHSTAVIVSGPISTALAETNGPNNRNSTQTEVPERNFTSPTTNVIEGRDLVSQGSEKTTLIMTEPTTRAVQATDRTTVPQATSLRMEILFAQTTAAPGSITCRGLGGLTSTSQVACFQYEEETTCEKLNEKKKEELRSFLCEIINNTQCNVTIHSSEIKPKCILWVPNSKDAESRLQDENFPTNNQRPTQVEWGQISDHQTRSQKTMIALVTCGVLLAFFILAGYFLSNRESWSPGRQRLGEDPYCTESDSQGNTLVSVSAHAQDKPNSGTRENGTGQTVSPAASNGHSTKKQTVSDTEL